ncbi:helix-turn-helix transcriptional regulator [Desulfosporosinus sp.]|uniref:helix-turn-helix transcriptional regulator n=1 Tax=Desulfosporosinus sp. TaxID=157907 RepID=UPI00263444DB|nr:helix-turn-helix transcriptional regulator [Desulfosporosinus sp.]MCO5387012.1 helix-turn-helix domain-containing protein [Desulfosporosinus sp.]
MNLRAELYRARRNARLTQEQIAERVGVDRTIYNKIERGKIKNVPVELAIQIAKEVNGSINKIFLISD